MTRFVVAVLLAVVSAASASAFNALGHKVVAEIAWRQLDPADRQAIVDTLRQHPRFDADFAAKMTDDVLAGNKATQDRWIFQHAATWPDIARDLPAGERSKYDRPTWHYVNFPQFLDERDRIALEDKLSINLTSDYRVARNKNDLNVLQAIAYSRATLDSQAAPNVKALAYCWVFHLVGDIHQPLHSTALFSVDQFPEGDRGGNEIPLVRGRNLHSLWDNLLGRQHHMRNVDKAVVELSHPQRFRYVWDTAAKEIDPRKWADESHEMCRLGVYSETILDAVRKTPAGVELSPIDVETSYMQVAGSLARNRIIAAGVRLGKLLGEADRDTRPERTRQLNEEP